MAVIVDAGGEQDDGVDHAASFTHFHRESVGGDERERARIVEGAVAKVVDELVEVGGHTADLGLRQRVDAEGLHEFVHAARGHAGEVAVGDDGDERGFGSFAAFEEPVGEVGA